MIDFLLHEGVSDLLLNFVTQIGSRRRPHPHENNSIELKFSYRFDLVLYHQSIHSSIELSWFSVLNSLRNIFLDF
jgi:hypothetical protein